jgi:hypothetical protein
MLGPADVGSECLVLTQRLDREEARTNRGEFLMRDDPLDPDPASTFIDGNAGHSGCSRDSPKAREPVMEPGFPEGRLSQLSRSVAVAINEDFDFACHITTLVD